MNKLHKIFIPVIAGSGSSEINTTAPTITPTLGANGLTNPGFEGSFVGGVGANWSKSGTPTCTQETTIKRSGSNSQKAVGDAGGVFNRTLTPTLNVWYRYSAYLYVTAGSVGIEAATPSVKGVSAAMTAAAWTEAFFTGRCDDATIDGPFIHIASAGTTLYADDTGMYPITFSTCLALLGTITRQDTTYVCHPTLGIGPQAGLVINYLDASNFVIGFYNRATGKAELLKCVTGTWTSLINTTVAYSAGAELKIIVSGTTYQLWYNGAQVGINQTISDALGTGVYAFATDASVAVGAVTTNPT